MSQPIDSSRSNVALTARADNRLIIFQGNLNNNNKVLLQWTVAENERDDRFEVERSTDGKNFRLAALVFTSEKTGNENYLFYENLNTTGKIYYRLKMYEKSGTIVYSKMLTFQTKANRKEEIKVVVNPVTEQLTLVFNRALTKNYAATEYEQLKN